MKLSDLPLDRRVHHVLMDFLNEGQKYDVRPLICFAKGCFSCGNLLSGTLTCFDWCPYRDGKRLSAYKAYKQKLIDLSDLSYLTEEKAEEVTSDFSRYIEVKEHRIAQKERTLKLRNQNISNQTIIDLARDKIGMRHSAIEAERKKRRLFWTHRGGSAHVRDEEFEDLR